LNPRRISASFNACNGALAQLGEHPLCKRKVIGSNPIRSIDRIHYHAPGPIKRPGRVLFIPAFFRQPEPLLDSGALTVDGNLSTPSAGR
jgi:hypothetical protein